MDPDLAGLRAFVAVAEELHFGRAALRLGISQPQVSRRVQTLEDGLGVNLFVRTARQTTLTEAGERLIEHARDTLAAADRLQRHAAQARRGGGGRVSVAFYWSTLSGYLAPLVAAAAERHPDIELTVAQTTTLEVEPGLRRGDLDLAITRPTFSAGQGDLIEFDLCREPAVLALDPGHPLAGCETLQAAVLNGLPMVALQRELAPTAYDAIVAKARSHGIDVNIVRHVRSAQEALALVSAGIGVFRLAASAATPFPGVVYRELVDAPSRLAMIHRPLPRPVERKIIDLAVELFGDADCVSKHAPPGLVRPAVTT